MVWVLIQIQIQGELEDHFFTIHEFIYYMNSCMFLHIIHEFEYYMSTYIIQICMLYEFIE
jgi:hypothetical protein